MASTKHSEGLAFEIEHLENLEKFVNETVLTMAESTALKPREVLSILESVHVKSVSELRYAIDALWDDIEAVQRVRLATLSGEVEKVIKAISSATDLDTSEITAIFSMKPGASLADVSHRLHQQSAHARLGF